MLIKMATKLNGKMEQGFIQPENLKEKQITPNVAAVTKKIYMNVLYAKNMYIQMEASQNMYLVQAFTR